MIVQCEQCQKQFKLNPDLLKRPAVKVRCSNCQHVFSVSRPEPPGVVETALTSPEVKSPPPTRPTSSRRLLILLIPLIVIAGGLALWLYVPWPVSKKTVPQTTGIEQLHLVKSRGFFIDNKEAGQLFVIQGQVRNDFPVPRRWIHLRAKLYTTDGQTARQLDFFAGTMLSDQQLQNVPLKELLGLIQRPPVKQNQVRTIAAREEVTFTVPFGDLPELTELSDYSVEILASQPA
jgi:predicted Zn finger-like uncharacterized protein